jgi:nucleoside transporter
VVGVGPEGAGEDQSVPTAIRFKLSILMFLQYFVWGAWYVTLGTWLGAELHFSGQQIGLAAGTTAISAIVSPFIVGMIADRFFATERVLSALHLVGGAVLLVVSMQHSFGHFYVLLLLYALCYMPTVALTNSLSFRQMSDPGAQFGSIRVLGTAGWIVAGLAIGFLKLEPTAVPMRIAAASSVLLGLFCFFLPHTPPPGKGKKVTTHDVLGLSALALLKERSFTVFAVSSFLICIPLQFYYAFTNPFLNEIGVSNAAGKMTMGQMSEVFFMLLIPWFFRRLGVKYMLVIGMLAWVSRYLLFAFGNSGRMAWMLYGGILLHGVCYDFFFVTGQIYVDQKASNLIRSAAQGFITFLTYGLGMAIGSWVSGRVVDMFRSSASANQHAWQSIWLVPACASFIVLAIFLLLFSESNPVAKEQVIEAESTPAR